RNKADFKRIRQARNSQTGSRAHHKLAPVMIRLFEQFGYKEEHKCTGLDPTDQRLLEKELQNRKIGSYVKTVIRKGEPCCCYKIDYNGSDDYRLMTSYFVGVDWVIENQLALHVCPKENE